MKNLLIFLLVILFGQISVSFGTGKPDLSHLDDDTRNIIVSKCYTKRMDGPVPYWNCLRKELKIIGK